MTTYINTRSAWLADAASTCGSYGDDYYTMLESVSTIISDLGKWVIRSDSRVVKVKV